MNDRFAKAAYAGCYEQYPHPSARDIDQAWDWIGDEQRKMWRAVAASVLKERDK